MFVHTRILRSSPGVMTASSVKTVESNVGKFHCGLWVTCLWLVITTFDVSMDASVVTWRVG